MPLVLALIVSALVLAVGSRFWPREASEPTVEEPPIVNRPVGTSPSGSSNQDPDPGSERDPGAGSEQDPGTGSEQDAGADPGSSDTLAGGGPGPQPAPPPSPTASGILQINAIPWAEVYVTGELKGTTPLKLELEAGTYEVLLRPHGREDDEQTVSLKVEADQTIKYTHRSR